MLIYIYIYAAAPRAHQSTDRVWPMPERISGAMKAGVPQTVKVWPNATFVLLLLL